MLCIMHDDTQSHISRAEFDRIIQKIFTTYDADFKALAEYEKQEAPHTSFASPEQIAAIAPGVMAEFEPLFRKLAE